MLKHSSLLSILTKACVFLLIFVLLLCQGCSEQDKKSWEIENKLVSENEALAILEKFNNDSSVHHLTGAQLAQVYCQACHNFPDPALLEKSLWSEKVLPHMAIRLRLKDSIQARVEPWQTTNKLSISSYGGNHPLITEQNWKKIVDYYFSEAPEKPLPQLEKQKVVVGLENFVIRRPAHEDIQAGSTTLIRYDPLQKLLFLGTRQNKLYAISGKHLEVKETYHTSSPPADIIFNKNGTFFLLNMGVMDPSEQAVGEVLMLEPEQKNAESKILLNQLARPVQFIFEDIDTDGRRDFVISEFGYNQGRLSWYQNKGTHYVHHTLNDLPGARRVLLQDMDGDGTMDLVVLMTQGQEGIYVYYNRGAGFTVETLIKFPPIYGSSDFSLVDFNKDGAIDILYTAGDNADFSYSLKNYHGVRIYLNDGKNNFMEHWFYPMYGAMRAIAEDFDQDGDYDIAAISYFPDFEKAAHESFVYFENKGNLTFSPATFETVPSGRWLTMESGDVDQDGDEDIILGSFSLLPSVGGEKFEKEWHTSGVPYLILENQLVRPSKASLK